MVSFEISSNLKRSANSIYERVVTFQAFSSKLDSLSRIVQRHVDNGGMNCVAK